MTLAPGELYELPWNGRFRRSRVHPGGGVCYEAFTPAPGRYVFTVCADQGGCARQEVTLPSSADIEINLSARSRAARCADLDRVAAAGVGPRMLENLRRTLRDRPVTECPMTPTCLSADALEARLAEVAPGRCAFVQIPRGDEVEYLVFLPLPRGYRGGARYSQFYDRDGSQLRRARYER